MMKDKTKAPEPVQEAPSFMKARRSLRAFGDLVRPLLELDEYLGDVTDLDKVIRDRKAEVERLTIESAGLRKTLDAKLAEGDRQAATKVKIADDRLASAEESLKRAEESREAAFKELGTARLEAQAILRTAQGQAQAIAEEGKKSSETNAARQRQADQALRETQDKVLAAQAELDSINAQVHAIKNRFVEPTA